MDIVGEYKKHFCSKTVVQSDFNLITLDSKLMMGVDKNNCVVIVVKSSSPKRSSLCHKTQKMSIECNVAVTYSLSDYLHNDVVHILRCLSENEKEKEMFLELACILIKNSNFSEEAIMEAFSTLRAFFKDNKEISDNELIGLYGELYTIYTFHNDLKIDQYWQSKDRMKFDFSFTEKMKLEIKTTTKNTRSHHFRHEQLMTELYDIYILSYLLRYDDEGLSLYELIQKCKGYFTSDASKALRIDLILKNVGEARLSDLRFNSEYTEQNRHFYIADKVPKFNEITPDGVSNAEYDCILDNVEFVEDNDFIALIKSII